MRLRTNTEQRILALLPSELTWWAGSKDWPASDPRVEVVETPPSMIEPGAVSVEILARSHPFGPKKGAALGLFAARLLPKGKEQAILERSRWSAANEPRAIRRRYDCTSDWPKAQRAGVTRLASVNAARLEVNLRNRGIGRAGYDALLAWAASHGAALIPARCIGMSTSPAAERTWRALLRDYPSSGSMAWLPEAVR